MEIIQKRRTIDILRGFFLLCHPLPVLFHTVAVTLFALLAAWPHISWGVLFLVVGAHVAMQLSIAVLNDYCDRERDITSRKNKPIPRGLVRPQEALLSGLLLILLMLLLLLPLSPLALMVSLLYLACGQSYNLGLKGTPFSGVVFALAMPLIPVYAFVGMGHVIPLILWFVPIAALLGIALNLANSLPDIESDAASNTRTLAVVLGVRGTFLACPLLILLALGLIGVLASTRLVPAQPWLLLPTLLLVVLSNASLLILLKWQKKQRIRKIYFYLAVFASLALAAGWLISTLP